MQSGRSQLRAWLRRSLKQQKELAAELSITDAYLSQILTGIRRPKLETLIQIERLTGVPLVSWADTGVSDADEPSNPEQIASSLRRVK